MTDKQPDDAHDRDFDDAVEDLGDELLTISAVDPDTGERQEALISRREWAEAQAKLADSD